MRASGTADYSLHIQPSSAFPVSECSRVMHKVNTGAVTQSRAALQYNSSTAKFCSILQASLSGTLLQTLPELVTPLKGYFYLHTAVHWCCESNTVSKHTCKHEVRLPWIKNEFCFAWNEFGLICDGVNNVGGYKRNPSYNLRCLLVLQTYSYFNTNEAFSETYGITITAVAGGRMAQTSAWSLILQRTDWD